MRKRLKKRYLWQVFPSRLHQQTDEIFSADVEKLLRLGYLLLRVDNQERNGQQQLSESLDGLAEFARRRRLVANLKN